MIYPKYYDYGGLNKIISKENGISIIDDRQELCVQVLQGSFPTTVIVKSGKEISKSVFDNAFQSALTKLNALVQKENKSWSDEGEESIAEMKDDANDLVHVNI